MTGNCRTIFNWPTAALLLRSTRRILLSAVIGVSVAVAASPTQANPVRGLALLDDAVRIFGPRGGTARGIIVPTPQALPPPPGWSMTGGGLYVPPSLTSSIVQAAEVEQAPRMVRSFKLTTGALTIGSLGTVFGMSISGDDIPVFKLAGDGIRFAAYCAGNPCRDLIERRVMDWYLAPFKEERSDKAMLVDCIGPCAIRVRGLAE